MTSSIMTKVRRFAAAAVLLGVALFLPGWTPAYGDSAQVSQLLEQARTSATQLNRDSNDMASYAGSRLSWEGHAQQINRIKEHINKSGEILAKLHEQRDGAEPWQQEAIDQITPMLQKLASNTESIINHLNDRQQTWHPEYEGYLKSNAETAQDLSTLIRDYVDYGKARSKTESLGKSLGFSES